MSRALNIRWQGVSLFLFFVPLGFDPALVATIIRLQQAISQQACAQITAGLKLVRELLSNFMQPGLLV